MSTVPDREFERPETIDDLKDLAFMGAEIITAALDHVGVEKERDDEWQILSKIQGDLVAAHGAICACKWVGLADWQKKASAA